MPCQTQGELRAREQEEQLRQQVEEPQENGQSIKAEPQAELPEAQSAITEVKKRNQEETRRIQKEMNLHQQRGDQQNQVTERVAVTPLVKDPLSRILEKLKEQLDTDFQKAHAKIMAREKRQEEEMKIIREKLNPLPQALQKQVSERGIATAVTKLVVSALLAFPVQSSRERGDASECHPALRNMVTQMED
ncbi:golgin subfamily A member 6-like protein 22 [Vidua macroura]|uniref:golgin subfamily A member 6-like protein 22 n=1 Tax=Vidua macroura TaxID=187451 RepID=UPI0023A8A8AF|nr:golgin subfamily A member 6-like protein 22 [Vidua macroura]